MKAFLDCECCGVRLEVASGKEASEHFDKPELEIRIGNFRAAAQKQGWGFRPTLCPNCKANPNAVTQLQTNQRRRAEYQKLYGAFQDS